MYLSKEEVEVLLKAVQLLTPNEDIMGCITMFTECVKTKAYDPEYITKEAFSSALDVAVKINLISEVDRKYVIQWSDDSKKMSDYLREICFLNPELKKMKNKLNEKIDGVNKELMIQMFIDCINSKEYDPENITKEKFNIAIKRAFDFDLIDEEEMEYIINEQEKEVHKQEMSNYLRQTCRFYIEDKKTEEAVDLVHGKDSKIDIRKLLKDKSGNIKIDSKLTSFLYELMRDRLPGGVVEELVQNCQISEVEYTNGWLARYAEHLAERLS